MNDEKKSHLRYLKTNCLRVLLGIVFIASPLLPCNAHADEVKVGVSFSIPPYVIQETNTGLVLDILRSALAVKGHRAIIQYRPLARTFHELKEGKLDADIRDDFNFGLAHIQQNGTLLAIQEKYQGLLSLNLDEGVTIRLATSPSN
jgi:hypothetical protein